MTAARTKTLRTLYVAHSGSLIACWWDAPPPHGPMRSGGPSSARRTSTTTA
jgi:hypothetical protein